MALPPRARRMPRVRRFDMVDSKSPLTQTIPQAALDAPTLSAVVVIPDRFETVHTTVRALRAQTIVSQIEIVYVVFNEDIALPPEATDKFAATQTIVLTPRSMAQGYAGGIRQARAPLVALTEDHSFPAPHWAERLVAAHQANHAVVAPAVRNGNPNSAVSWANFLIDYGEWADPVPAATRDFLPGHNSVYRKSVLTPYMAKLEEWFEAEVVLHWELRRQGYSLWLESSTYTRHYNFALWSPFLGSHWHSGRIFAAERAASWNWARRIAYALAAPLIPFVRFVRVRRAVQRMRFGPGVRARIYAAIVAGLAVDGLSQAIGYVAGAGKAEAYSLEYEFHRFRYAKAKATLNPDV